MLLHYHTYFLLLESYALGDDTDSASRNSVKVLKRTKQLRSEDSNPACPRGPGPGVTYGGRSQEKGLEARTLTTNSRRLHSGYLTVDIGGLPRPHLVL